MGTVPFCRTSHGDTAMCLLAQHRQEKRGSGWAQTSWEWFARQAESRHAGAAGTSWAVGFQSMSLLLQGKESNNCPLRQTSTTEGDECSGLNSPKPKLSMEWTRNVTITQTEQCTQTLSFVTILPWLLWHFRNYESKEKKQKLPISWKRTFPISICSPKSSHLEITGRWHISPWLGQCEPVQSLTQDLSITLMTLSCKDKEPFGVSHPHYPYNSLLSAWMKPTIVTANDLSASNSREITAYQRFLFWINIYPVLTVPLTVENLKQIFTQLCQRVYPQECRTALPQVSRCATQTQRCFSRIKL